MKRSWQRILLGFAFLGGFVMLVPSCVVRGGVGVTGGVVVDEPPPAPRYQVQVVPRAGHVWVRGRYIRSGSRWVWRRGRYKRVRRGHYWAPGKWRYINGRYRWRRGRWVSGGYARVAPPPRRIRRTRVVPRRGHYWVRGRNVWNGRRWVWRKGHWRRTPRRYNKGYVWVPGRNVLRGGRYVYVRGHWRRR